MASGPRRRPGLDPRRVDPLRVEPRRRPHPAVALLRGPAFGRPARSAGRAPGAPGRHVGRRRPRGVPGDGLLRSGVAQLPRRAGPAGEHRVDGHVEPGDAAVGGRAPDGPGLDGRRRLLPLRARLGRQRLVVRPPHRRGAAAHPARGLRREVARRRGRRRGLRAGGLPARARSAVGSQPEAGHPRRGRHELVATPLGRRPAGPPAGRPALPHREARALRVARRALHRSRRGRVVAQPDPQPGRRGPIPRGRRTGPASPGSTTRAGSTASSSRTRTARTRAASTSPTRPSTSGPSGRPTARSWPSPTPTTACSSWTSTPATSTTSTPTATRIRSAP